MRTIKTVKRLPTKEDFEKLIKLPTKWDREKGETIFTAENGNELRFPLLGSGMGDGFRSFQGTKGEYWSSTRKKINKIWGEYAYVLYFSGEDARIDDAEINEDYNVRLVSDKPCDDFVDMGTGVYWAKENTKKNQFRSCFTWKEAMKIKK